MKLSKRNLVTVMVYLLAVYFAWCTVALFTSARKPAVEENSEMTPEIPSIALETEKEPVLSENEKEEKTKFNKDNKLFLLSFEKIPNTVTQKFVERFLNTAIVEKWKYNIPISISLSQGIVESACGTSTLARKANNFFGMKCLQRCNSCNGKKWQVIGNCINAHDDSRHDMFQMFKSPWYSWRAHSILLTMSRYNHLRKLNPLEYKKWARGLKRAGYATAPKYAEILINYIEMYKLNQYDKMPIEKLAAMRGIDLTKIPKHK